MACSMADFFGPRPWGLGEGPKGLIKKLCVSSHKCKRRIFIRSPGSCPRSGTWGIVGGGGGGMGDHFFFTENQPDLMCKSLT